MQNNRQLPIWDENGSQINKKFFIPFTDNQEQETRFYQSIKNFVCKTREIQEFDKRKVRFLEFNNEHNKIKAGVGDYIDLNNEMVIAILYDSFRKSYHICTPSSGVVRGKSIIVSESNVTYIEDFEAN
jgi:hypothetical protein